MTGLTDKQDAMVVEFDGLMIEGPSHSRSYLERLRGGLEESFMVSLFRMLIRPGATVLDIGAFLGQYSLPAAQQVGSTGRVYAFEPDSRNYPYLVRNLERNSLRDRVVTVPFAVGDKDETRTLFLDPVYWNESSIAFRRRGRMMPVSVRCVTLDEFLGKSLVVDVVKLDVEGGELRALSGME